MINDCFLIKMKNLEDFNKKFFELDVMFDGSECCAFLNMPDACVSYGNYCAGIVDADIIVGDKNFSDKYVVGFVDLYDASLFDCLDNIMTPFNSDYIKFNLVGDNLLRIVYSPRGYNYNANSFDCTNSIKYETILDYMFEYLYSLDEFAKKNPNKQSNNFSL